jgi:hypothetical protein
MTVSTPTGAIEHYDDFVRLRKAGHSYREIGLKFGLSHERVRQILVAGGEVDEFARTPSRSRRREQIEEITEWLEAEGPVERNRVLEKFGITSNRLNSLIAEGVPSHLILMSARETKVQFTDDVVRDALHRAWAELQRVNPKATGLSHVMYERLRRMDDPSSPLLVSRYGWENACSEFGVPAGETWRPKASYTSRWTDEELLEFVRAYTADCRVSEERPSYLGFERWQQLRPEAPSGTLVRNRMRERGIRTWPEVVVAASAAA